jgi:hypothetical protein
VRLEDGRVGSRAETSFVVGCGALLAACSLAMTIALRPSEPAVAPLLKDAQLGFLGIVLLGFGILLLRWPAVAAKRRLELIVAWGFAGVVFLACEHPQLRLMLALAVPVVVVPSWLMRPRLAPCRRELLLLGFVLVPCLGAAEVAARVHLFGWRGLLPSYGNSITVFDHSGLVRSSQDLPYELVPNADRHFMLTRVQVNSQGWRDRESPLAKPADTFRVAVIGDSVTQAFGVDIEEAYHSRLEAHCTPPAGFSRCEFLNFGIAGYGLVDYVTLLERRVLAYEPDHILVGLYPRNDLEATNDLAASSEGATLQQRQIRYDSYGKLWIARVASLALDGLRSAAPTATPPLLTPEAIDAALARLTGLAEERDIPISLVALRRGVDIATRELDLLRSAARRHELPVLDTGPDFAGVDIHDTIVSLLDGHPNAYAHSLFARSIERGLLPQLFARASGLDSAPEAVAVLEREPRPRRAGGAG